MNDDQYLLASAYLDGELDAAERAAAEADPDVMSEVERLRAVSASVRGVDPPNAARRDAAIAAALREFDATHAAPPARVVAFRPRPAYARWISAAAAVVGVGLLGTVIAGNRGGDDEASVGRMDAASTEESATDLRVPAPMAESDVTASAAQDVGEDAVGGAESYNTMSAPTDAPMAEPSGDASQEPTAMEPPAEPATTSFLDPDAPIADQQSLGLVGAKLLADEEQGALAPTPETACGSDGALPPVLGEGWYRTSAGDVPILIAVDRATRETVAVDRETCAIIARAAAP